MAETLPDLEGDKPDHVDPTDWLIATLFAHPDQGGEGLSTTKVAKRVGMSRGGVSGRIRRMRLRGWDIKAPNPPKFTEEQRAKGRATAAIVTNQKWGDARDGVVDRLGRIADSSSQVVEVWLEKLLDDPERIVSLDTLEVLRIAMIADRSANRADQLRRVNEALGDYGVEGIGEGTEYAVVIESMEVAVRAFKATIVEAA